MNPSHFPKPRIFHPCTGWVICCLAWLLAGEFPTAQALDPQRPLSQALLRIWQAPQGLPRSAILSLRQDSTGYLWLGTQAGLHRFDGVRFVATDGGTEQALAHVWIRDLCADRDHGLWLASDHDGLYRVHQGRVQHWGKAEGLPSEQIRCLALDVTGALWIGTDLGLARFANGQFQTYRTTSGLPHGSIRALHVAADGKLWIGTDGPHVVSFNGETFEPLAWRESTLSGTIHALLTTQDNTLWVGTSAGLLRRTPTAEQLFTTQDGLGSECVYCLAAMGNKQGIWVGTKDGFCRIQGEHVERFQTRDGLSQSTVYSLCEDHEGSLWVGTKHGLNQFVDRRTLLPFTINEGLPSNDTGPIVQDSHGDIWVGTLDAGVARFDGTRFTRVATTQNGLPSDTVQALAPGGADELWIGTDQGLCRLQAGEIVDRFTTAQGLPADNILALARDPSGALWAGTSAGLAELRDGRFAPPLPNTQLHTRPVQAMLHVPDKYLVVAFRGGGLYRVQDRQLQPLSSHLPASLDVDAIHADHAGRLWVAIRGVGLGCIEDGKLVTFSVKDGLYDDDIFGIASDNDGRLWMACSRGIFSVASADLQRFASGEIKRLANIPFSPTDALRTIECQSGVQPAIWKMHDGRIWLATIRGVIVADPQRWSRQLPTPAVVVEEVRVNGQPTPLAELGHVPPGRTNIDFQYTALSLASPGRIAFRYQLEGFDKEWIEAGPRREAFYTNLAPGEYRFRVQAINSDGSETEAAAPIHFTLDPYFYQTRWFLPAIALGLIGLVVAAYRLRIRQIQGRLQAVLAERSRIARELHDTLIQGFSGVTMQMQALATRLRGSPDHAALNDIISDAGGCLREARRSVAGLRNTSPGESGLAAAIGRAARQLTETSNARLQLRLANLQTELPPDVEYNLLRIIQEAIANANKHASANTIEVVMTADARLLTITVHDDGIGFDTRLHLNHAQPGHYGLVGMRERAAQIDAQIHWRSEAQQGTTVTLTRPFATGPYGRRTSPQPDPSAVRG